MSTKKLMAGLVVALAAATGLVAPGGSATATAPAAGEESPWWPPAAPTQLVIDTGGVPIGREDYVAGTVTLDGTTRVTEVRGRGNSTWKWPKKPYKLKLEEDAALVGSTPYDEWVLLAGYADRSALRTAAAFAIAAETRLLWTPQFRFVDVVINGQPQGLYLLTEQVEAGDGRVELPDNGHLLEINQRYLRDDEPGFRTYRGTPVAFKDPDEVTKAQRRAVRRAVTRFEKVLYGPRFADPTTGYAAYVDVKKLIDWYLVEELFGNQDSNFQSSVNFSWIPGEKFVFGPVWDFDLSAGTRWRATGSPEAWLTRVGDHWIARMLEDPAFSRRVKSRWAALKPVVEKVISEIPAAAAPLAASAEADWQQWHVAGDLEWTAHASTPSGEVTFLRDWLTTRTRWLSRNEVRLGATQVRTRERERTVWVPVQLQSSTETPVHVDYETVAGTATAGVDFAAADAQLHFAPGQVLGYVPVRVLGDTEGEAAETVLVRLKGTHPDLELGLPRVATVTIGASDQRLDATIRRAGRDRTLGAGLVNPDGRGQLLSTRLDPGQRRSFDVRVTNTGTHPVTFRLAGRSSGPLAVRYVIGGDDVTRSLSSTSGRGVRIDPGSFARVRVQVRLRPGADADAVGRAVLRAAWRGDESVVDLVGARVTVR